MALEAVVPESAFETLDESLKTFYVQNTETKEYYLDVSGADRLAVNLQVEKSKLAENNKALMDQLAQAKAAKAELETKLKADTKAKNADETAQKIAEYELKLNSLNEALDQERKQRETIAAQNARSLREAEIARVMAKFNMVPTAAANLREATTVKETDGQYSVQVIDPTTGQPVLVAAQPVSLEQMVAQWQAKSEFGTLFQANGSGGTGAPGRQGKPGSGKTIPRAEYNQNPAAYMADIRAGAVVVD